MDKKIRPIYMLPPRDPPHIERYTQIKSKEIFKKTDILFKWEEKSWCNNTMSEKINFKTKTRVGDKEENYIIVKGTIQQEDITIGNIYALKLNM